MLGNAYSIVFEFRMPLFQLTLSLAYAPSPITLTIQDSRLQSALHIPFCACQRPSLHTVIAAGSLCPIPCTFAQSLANISAMLFSRA